MTLISTMHNHVHKQLNQALKFRCERSWHETCGRSHGLCTTMRESQKDTGTYITCRPNGFSAPFEEFDWFKLGTSATDKFVLPSEAP